MKNSKYIFERIVLTVLAIALLVEIGVTIYNVCTRKETATQVEEPEDMLIEIESHINYIIMYDKDTKVVYYRGLGVDADLVPLYNADGSLKLYSGGNNND